MPSVLNIWSTFCSWRRAQIWVHVQYCTVNWAASTGVPAMNIGTAIIHMCIHTSKCTHRYTKDTAILVTMYIPDYHPNCQMLVQHACIHVHTVRTHARTHEHMHAHACLHSHIPSHPASSRGPVCLHWHRPSTPAHPSHALQLEGASAPGRRRKRGGESVGNIHDTRMYNILYTSRSR